MDENRPNFVDCGTSSKKNKTKFLWDNATFKAFIDACLVELDKGNKIGCHFNKVGWKNLEITMEEKTGKVLKQKQIKNKWDNMKKEWKLYDSLTRLETELGGMRRLNDASPEWWDEKIKVDKNFAKFRGVNLDIFETHYAPLFRGSVAVEDQIITPLQCLIGSNPSDVRRGENIEGTEGTGDNDEINLGDDEPLFLDIIEFSSSKRKTSKDVVANKRSTKSKTSYFEEKLDAVLDALSSKSTQTFPANIHSPTIANCMDIVITFPGFTEGSRKYSLALRAFIKKENREAFMYPTTHEAKMEFLKVLIGE